MSKYTVLEKLLSFEDIESEDKDLENLNKLSKYKYFPKNKEELSIIVDNLIEARGNRANLNDIYTGDITDMSYLFFNIDFNGDISDWNVSSVEDMTYMFAGSQFNNDISKWDVSNVKYMSYMFITTSFNGDISNWDVSNVKSMSNMFYNSDFNKDISNWDVSNVKNMTGMFAYSHFTYKQEIKNNWNIQPDCNVSDMFRCCFVDKPELQEKLLSFEDVESENNDLENLNELTKYNYYPKDKFEFERIVRKLIKERGNNADLNDIYTGDITDMSNLFFYNASFNGDISKWDVSNVEDMTGMFRSSNFNGDISKWNVSKVKYMASMFFYSSFNGDISKWDVHNVEGMSNMFAGTSFNGDISKWDVSKVRNMAYMFLGSEFNGDISNWDVHNVRYMSNMFYNSDFNGDISKWKINPKCDTRSANFPKKNVNEKLLSFEDIETEDKDLESLNKLTKYKYYPKTYNELKELIVRLIEERGIKADLNDIYTGDITDMSWLFFSSNFNGDISKWDVHNVENMCHMFAGSYLFEGDISNWDVSNVTNMSHMFANSPFNGDISKWDVHNVENMCRMFYNSDFNGDISKWDVSNVKDMSNMFASSSFNGDISKWKINPKCNIFYANLPKKKVNEKLLSFEDTETEDKDLDNLNFVTTYNYYPKTRNELVALIDKLIKERGGRANLNDICTSQITNMNGLFANEWTNPDISEWDVSNVKTMKNMFMGTKLFNGDISKWDVSNVEDMNGMFSYSMKFNCDISKWNVSNVKDTRYMFFYSSAFNQDISDWDVSKVERMDDMFFCSNLSPGNRLLIIDKWKKIISPEWSDYLYAETFGHYPEKLDEKLLSFEDTDSESIDLENLNKLTKYNYFPKTRNELVALIDKLIGERGYEADLNDIYTGNITAMYSLFAFTSFNGDISKWDVSNVKDMRGMFCCSKFNGDISKWDVSNVENMCNMFYGSRFNGDISKWDVSNVRYMDHMFYNSKFDLDNISNWNINPKCKDDTISDEIFNFPKKKVNEKLLSFEDTESEDNDLDKLNKISKIIENKKWFNENCIIDFKDYLNDKKDENCTFVRIKKKDSKFFLPLYNYMNKTTYEILSPNMWFDTINKFRRGFGAFSAVPDDKPEISNFINEKGELLRPDLAEQIIGVIGFSDLPDAAWIKFKSDKNDPAGSYEDYIRRDGSLVFNNLDGHIIFEMPFCNYKDNFFIGRHGINFDDYVVPGQYDNKGSDIYMLIKEKDKGYNLLDINFNPISPNLYFDKILRPGSYVTNTTWVRVMKDGKFNYLNCATGEIISKDLWFDKVTDSFLIKHKVAKVIHNGTYYFIDENGELYEDIDKTKKVDIEKIKSEDTSKKDAIFEECWFSEADNYQNIPKYFFERRKHRNTEKNRPWYAVYILLSKYGIMRKDMILNMLWPGKTGLQLELFQFLNSAKIAETIKSGPNRGYLMANNYNNWRYIPF